MKQLMTSSLAFSALFAVYAANLDFRRPHVIPEPTELTYDAAVPVRVAAGLPVIVTCPDESAAAWVGRHIRDWFGVDVAVSTTKEGPIGVAGGEGYTLSAKPGRIEIGANTLQGVKYAVHTLRQAAERESVGRTLKGYWLPALEIKDAPALAFRGVHFCWFTESSPAFIEHQIRLAAYYKFNYAVVESWGVFKSEKHPYLAVRDAPLTVKEAHRLAALAKDLGLTLIPQINVFGHASGARARGGKHVTLDVRPEYQPLFEPAGGWNWCLSNPEARAVVREVVAEMHEAFDNPPFFHIGCDEADEPSCPTCRAIKPYASLVETHIREVHDLLRARGARAMMWHDMLLEKGDARWKPFYANGTKDEAAMLERLPRDIVICDWYYGSDSAGNSKDTGRSITDRYPTLEHFKGLGFDTLTCPWRERKGIVAQSRYAREKGLLGVLETVWHHFRGREFELMMSTTADAVWGNSAPAFKGRGTPFMTHWRQVGWDMGISDYLEGGYYDRTVTRDILDN